ncbi:nucleotidyltransferase family protein [Fusibacter sp. JL216-2]|uniref:nucleotidyltransferase family protein n=1 Tax=Fusibacter sp. JL216-2 TaxID=3071453 RepID=UPI003D33BD93
MVGAVILAAGLSRRMGKSKLTLMLDKIPIIEHVIRHVEASDVDSIVLVYSKYTKDVKALADRHGILSLNNDHAEKGLSTTVKLGLSNMLGEQGVMFVLGDQPFIETKDINLLIGHFKKNRDKIIVPVNYEGRGNPVIFPEKYFKDILAIDGDKGARQLLDKYIDDVIFIEVGESKIQFDVDTVDDFEAARKLIR